MESLSNNIPEWRMTGCTVKIPENCHMLYVSTNSIDGDSLAFDAIEVTPGQSIVISLHVGGYGEGCD